MYAPPDGRLGGRDLLEGSADVHGARPRATGRFPGNRTVERPVDFEDSRAVAITLETPAVARRKSMARDGEYLTWREVEEYGLRGREVAHRTDRLPRFDLASQTFEVSGERARDGFGATAWEGPVASVTDEQQHESDRRRRQAIEGKKRVGGATGEESARRRSFEECVRQAAGRAQRADAESRDEQRMLRPTKRTEEPRQETRVVAHERSEELAVRGTVGAE